LLEQLKDSGAEIRKTAPRSNLLVVRAGDSSLHPGWLADDAPRNFDLLISYYGDQPDRYRNEADHYHVMQGPRWPAHDAICKARYETLAAYEQVCFACDDLVAKPDTWNRLFAACRRYDLDLAQPAIEGPVSHEITRPVEGSKLRYTNFVEIMCPVFSARALRQLCGTFGESVSGWGLNWLWPKLLAGDMWRIGILDSVRITHSRPVGEGTLYSLLSSLGVDPRAEKAALQTKFDLFDLTPRELGRVALKGKLP
jgi:hypothetical protein